MKRRRVLSFRRRRNGPVCRPATPTTSLGEFMALYEPWCGMDKDGQRLIARMIDRFSDCEDSMRRMHRRRRAAAASRTNGGRG